MKKKWILILILLISMAGYFAWQAYQKPLATLHHVNPDIEITAEQLFADYAAGEDAANQKYLGKIIKVTGHVLDINNNDSGYSTVYLDTGDMMGSISCQLEKGEEKKAETLITGQELSLKGKCTGFAMDVVLTQCIINP
jgi:hypothetical protein